MGEDLMSINRNSRIDREETIKLILTPNRREYTGGENWLGHGKRSGGAANVDYMLLDGATMTELLNQRGAIYDHFSHLKNEHGLSIKNTGEIYKIDRTDLGISEEAEKTSFVRSDANSLYQGEVPTREEIEKILRGIAPKGIEIDEGTLKSAVERTFSSDGRPLKPGWWEITKINLMEWSKKG